MREPQATEILDFDGSLCNGTLSVYTRATANPGERRVHIRNNLLGQDDDDCVEMSWEQWEDLKVMFRADVTVTRYATRWPLIWSPGQMSTGLARIGLHSRWSQSRLSSSNGLRSRPRAT